LYIILYTFKHVIIYIVNAERVYESAVKTKRPNAGRRGSRKPRYRLFLIDKD